MIESLEGMPPGVIGLRASGKVSAEDYKQVLAPTLESALAEGGKVRLVYELGPDYDGFETGGVWQDLRMGATHFNSFERVALVTDVDWIRHAANTLGFLMPGDMKVYGLGERDAAVAWAAGSP
jgi:stage II sporulation SpoAA-like protein